MYSRFLAEAGIEEGASRAAAAADNWTALADAFKAASEQVQPSPEASRIGELSQQVLASEEALWSGLAGART